MWYMSESDKFWKGIFVNLNSQIKHSHVIKLLYNDRLCNIQILWGFFMWVILNRSIARGILMVIPPIKYGYEDSARKLSYTRIMRQFFMSVINALPFSVHFCLKRIINGPVHKATLS